MARGHIEKRGEDTYRLKVELEPDPTTGERRVKRETLHGSKKDAEVRLTEMLSLADQRMLGVDAKTTAGDYLDRWLDDYAKAKAPKTYQRYQEIVTNWLKPYLGNKKLTKLTTADIVHLVAKLREAPRRDRKPGKLSPQSVKHALRCLHIALACAVKWQLIPRNPADGVDAPSAPRIEMRTFDVDQAQRFLAATGAEGLKWTAFFTVSMTTGLRLGEIIGLRWVDVDLDRGVLRVQQAIQRLNKVGIIVKPPKTAGSRRPIAIGADVVSLVRKHRVSQAATRLQMGPIWKESGLVFPSETGSPLCDKTIRTVFTRTCERAGVPRIRLYDLRHTAASLLLAGGTHPKIVAERLGHSTVNLTLNTYSHVLPTLQADAAETMDRLLRAGRA